MEKGKRRQDQREVDLVRAYQSFFESADGKSILYDLMDKGFFMKPTFEEKVHGSERNEGKRELVLYIVHKMNLDIKQIMELIKGGESDKEKYVI